MNHQINLKTLLLILGIIAGSYGVADRIGVTIFKTDLECRLEDVERNLKSVTGMLEQTAKNQIQLTSQVNNLQGQVQTLATSK